MISLGSRVLKVGAMCDVWRTCASCIALHGVLEADRLFFV